MESKKKLLLVDDDGLVLATMGKGLEEYGFIVSLADNGMDAVKLAAKDKPDLAILDLRMPGLSGLETAQELKKLGVPSMFLSAHNDKESVKQAIIEDAMGYLVKPIDVSKAIPSIEAALERSQDLNGLRDTENRLNNALQTGNQVNVAVGIIMERKRLPRQEAYELLRNKARSEQCKVKEIANDILAAWEKFNNF